MEEKIFYVKINNNNDYTIITIEKLLRYFRLNIIKSVPIDGLTIMDGHQLILGLKFACQFSGKQIFNTDYNI